MTRIIRIIQDIPTWPSKFMEAYRAEQINTTDVPAMMAAVLPRH